MGGQALQAVFYDFMTICANYTKTMVFFCAFCHIVSGAVSLVLSCCVVCCGLVWSGVALWHSVARFKAL